MDIEDNVCKYVVWIRMAQIRIIPRPHVNSVMNLRVL
jgi:hypothetical protein